jgi:hypothetical protein
MGRLVGIAFFDTAAEAAPPWAARPEITADDLRKALADTLAVKEMTPPPSDSLKGDYLCYRNDIDGAIDAAARDLAPFLNFIGYRERIRRSLNLVYANLLSQADRPRYRRSAICGKLGLFARDPAAPYSSNVLSDEEIERRILSFPGPDAQILHYLLPPTGFFDVFDIERARQSALILTLSLQLHYREHGEFPTALNELVKNGYLKSIPADPFGKGEPFHYRRETDPRQGAVLWSVWTDGIDQHGKLDAFRDHGNGLGDRIYTIAAPRQGLAPK